jgi:hypothetical protein
VAIRILVGKMLILLSFVLAPQRLRTRWSTILALRAFYLDALGLFYCASALDGYLQDAVLKASMNFALVGALRQAEGAAEGAVAALPYVVAAKLFLLLDFALTLDGEHVRVQRDVHVFGLYARKLGPDEEVPVLHRCVNRRRPLTNPFKPLASRAAAP